LAVQSRLLAGAVAGDGELHGTGTDDFDFVGVAEQETDLGHDFFLLRHLSQLLEQDKGEWKYPRVMNECAAGFCARREFACCYVL